MDEHFPNEVGSKWSIVLLAYACTEISMLTVLHDDVDTSAIDEGVLVTHDEMGVKFGQGCDFLHGFKCSLFWQLGSIDLLNYVSIAHDDGPRLVISFHSRCHVYSESTLAQVHLHLH